MKEAKVHIQMDMGHLAWEFRTWEFRTWSICSCDFVFPGPERLLLSVAVPNSDSASGWEWASLPLTSETTSGFLDKLSL